MKQWKSHAMLLFFDVLALIAVIYTTFWLVGLWNEIATAKQSIRQDTSIGFGFIGLVVIGVHLLSVSTKKHSFSHRKLNILSTGLLILLVIAAFMTNHIVATHLRNNGYVVCGHTETNSRIKYPVWIPTEICKSRIQSTQ